MSKILYIARHAKAEEYSSSDFERHLTPGGCKDVQKVGNRLFEMGEVPEMIISSPAPRALQTAELLMSELKVNKKNLAIEPLLYDTYSEFELIKLIQSQYDSIDKLMLVGHNPTLKSLADTLFEKDVEWFPKGVIIGLEFNVDLWKDVKPNTGVLLFFTHPKEFIYYDINQLFQYHNTVEND